MQDLLRDDERWEQVRARYPVQEPLLNLNNAAVSPPARVVEQAVIEAFRLISRNPDVNMWSGLDARTDAHAALDRARAPCAASVRDGSRRPGH